MEKINQVPTFFIWEFPVDEFFLVIWKTHNLISFV